MSAERANHSTILLVDDDETLAQVLGKLLTRDGHTVVRAGSVGQALEVAREKRPALGLLDLSLPDGDGVELARRLGADVGRFPLILMTAYPVRLAEHPELARQFARVLTKPLDLDELRRAVDASLTSPVPAPAAQPVATPDAAQGPAPPSQPPSQDREAEPARPAPTRRLVPVLLGAALLALGLLLVLPALGVAGLPNLLDVIAPKHTEPAEDPVSPVKLDPRDPDAFEVERATLRKLKVPKPIIVAEKALPRRLELSGSLAFDPNRLAGIKSRFPGEVVSLGTNEERGPGATGQTEPDRPLKYGDYVSGPGRRSLGQLMAVVWCKDLGEKKSELVDALVQLNLDEESLRYLEALYKEGNTSEAVLRAARRAVSGDLSAANKAERTLRIWRVPEEEIRQVKDEAKRIIARNNKRDPKKEKDWARVEVRAPFDGVVVEKNVTVGAIVDTNTDLYKVADVSKLAVYAHAYEEDLHTLEALRAQYAPRRIPWKVYLTADPSHAPLKSDGIERIGYIVDPNQHTDLVMGLVDNGSGRLRAGQFVTATVEVPAPPGVVSVPLSALVEDGSESVVFLQPDPEKPRFLRRRVSVVQRFQGTAYVRSRLSEQQKARGLHELKPGDSIVTASVIELKAALEEVLDRARDAQK